jgi:hypothetical protein
MVTLLHEKDVGDWSLPLLIAGKRKLLCRIQIPCCVFLSLAKIPWKSHDLAHSLISSIVYACYLFNPISIYNKLKLFIYLHIFMPPRSMIGGVDIVFYASEIKAWRGWYCFCSVYHHIYFFFVVVSFYYSYHRLKILTLAIKNWVVSTMVWYFTWVFLVPSLLWPWPWFWPAFWKIYLGYNIMRLWYFTQLFLVTRTNTFFPCGLA